MEVYLDNSATTRPYDDMLEVMMEVMKTSYGNPSSAHLLGKKAEDRLNEFRQTIANTLGCTKNEIIFTSGGSESNNFLIRGFAKAGSHIITTKIEHPSVLNTCAYLEKNGVEVTYLDVDNYGKVDFNKLEESIKKNTVLVSIMHVNNEIGTIQDIKSISNIIKKNSSRAKFHVDAVQSYGKIKIDVNKMGIDLLSASGHKIHGPRGIGIGYFRKGLNPEPLIHGGGQEFGYRSGTENLSSIAGLSYAAEKIHRDLDENNEKVKILKEYFVQNIKDIPDIRLNSPISEDFIPHIVNVSFPGIRGEVFIHLLEEKGIFVSTGSACSSKKSVKSGVLKSIGLNDKEIEGAIRFSFNYTNTIEELEYTLNSVNDALKFLRRVRR
ncbi:MAG: cysteine desulfurase family protein [Bacillota bacterium]|nr:cysteine desulfurase family protein [Bacillota bacterium]